MLYKKDGKWFNKPHALEKIAHSDPERATGQGSTGSKLFFASYDCVKYAL
jgi:hypothetical protein